jgi:hypothetical protein
MTLTCRECKAEFEHPNRQVLYCADCRLHVSRRQARESHNRNNTREQMRVTEARRTAKIKERGKALSSKLKEDISWDASTPLALDWIVRFKVPFSWHVSKNATHLSTRQGGRYMREESRSIKDAITLLVRTSYAPRLVVQNKVWLDILVQKPNNRGDAVNVVDLVCDGIKVGLGLDDKWFSIRRLDWEIAKHDPHIFIGIGQASGEAVDACTHCGRLLPLTELKSPKAGCSDCRLTPRH